jgi:hypothetical protein
LVIDSTKCYISITKTTALMQPSCSYVEVSTCRPVLHLLLHIHQLLLIFISLRFSPDKWFFCRHKTTQQGAGSSERQQAMLLSDVLSWHILGDVLSWHSNGGKPQAEVTRKCWQNVMLKQTTLAHLLVAQASTPLCCHCHSMLSTRH